MTEAVTAGDGTPLRLECFIDPMCPYAFQAGRWLRALQRSGDVDVQWRFFSLEEINHEPGKKHPWERAWSYGWSQMRIGVLMRRSGQQAVGRWYEGVGEAFHVHGRRTHDPAVHRAVLAELGFDPAVLDAALADPSTADEVRADHEYAVGVLGAFGVPTIVLPSGRATFLQMVPAPDTLALARDLLALLVAYDRFPTVFELRHPKRSEDLGLIARTFEPYLRAREWRTIENPAP